VKNPRYLLIAVICFLLSLWCLSGIASAQTPQTSAPKWAVVLATAGPIADGLSTHYALGQPGVREGNPFFSHLFGSNVTRNEILGFKVGQAALTGWAVHSVGKVDRKGAIGIALLTAGVNFGVSYWNMKQVEKARGLR
jgi:hypothetical protein